MQRIMIVSDTHRRHGNLAEAIYNEGHLDMLIHLGDVEGEEEVIKSIAGCETIFIAGNNDFFSPLDREKEIELGGKKIWLTHGHNYYVSLDLKVIEQEAVARINKCYIILHDNNRPVCIPTYIILEINDNNEFNFELKNV